MRRRATLGLAVLAVATVWPAGAQTVLDPVGRWRFHHTDGSTFLARLLEDHTATTDFGGGEWGIWRREGAAVRVVYTDGWDDLVSVQPDGSFRKRGWSPGSNRCATPANDGPVERLTRDTGAPLVGAPAVTGIEGAGRWRLFHADGTAFVVRLAPDQTARSDADGGQRGIWRRDGDGVRVFFTDGWEDYLSRGPDGRDRKQAWGPDADRCGPPVSTGPAERISADPGPPL